MVSLGCPKNTVDGEVLLGDLWRRGYDVVDDHDASDVVLVNTCAFVEDARAESVEAVVAAVELKAAKEGKRVVVTGCMAQRHGAELADAVPEVDLVVGFERYGELGDALEVRRKKTSSTDTNDDRVRVGAATVPFRPEGGRVRLGAPHTAYLRVAEGCSHACTFCAIPGFRGKFRSKPWQDALEEARGLVAAGAVELCLIAEDTNQYGLDRRHDDTSLAKLLAELRAELEPEGLRWIRILYAYPSYFDDALVDEIARNPLVCKYLDLPLQHLSDPVLLAMNRPPRDHTERLLRALRDRIPGLALRTTFIAGFPGERPADHAEVVAFCREFGFERMGAFAYSEEDGTRAAATAAEHPGLRVDEATRDARRDELQALAQRMGERFARSLVGSTVDVLVDDGPDAEGVWVGRTQWDAPDVDPCVLLREEEDDDPDRRRRPLRRGEIRRCLVDGTSVTDLFAHPVD